MKTKEEKDLDLRGVSSHNLLFTQNWSQAYTDWFKVCLKRVAVNIQWNCILFLEKQEKDCEKDIDIEKT